MLGQTAVMARTDYIVNGKRDAMVFLTASQGGWRRGAHIHGAYQGWRPALGIRRLDCSRSGRWIHHHAVHGPAFENGSAHHGAARGFPAQGPKLDRCLRIPRRWEDLAIPEPACAGHRRSQRKSAEHWSGCGTGAWPSPMATALRRSKYEAVSARMPAGHGARKSCSAAMRAHGTSDTHARYNGRTANS